MRGEFLDQDRRRTAVLDDSPGGQLRGGPAGNFVRGRRKDAHGRPHQDRRADRKEQLSHQAPTTADSIVIEQVF